MNTPLVSVVMSVFNEPERYLRESIESVLRQTLNNFEFIIVLDNPEYEKAYEIVNSYAKSDNRIKIISNKENEGLASSLNKAFSIARGKFIARMDADDISFADRLEKQLSFIENHPDLMLIGSSMIYVDEDKKILESSLARSNYKFLKKFVFYGGTPCFHPTWFFRKDLLNKLNGYRTLPTSQDYDFLMRLFYLGIRASNMEEPLLYHRMHQKRISAEKNVYQLKLTWYIMKAAKKGFILNDEKFSPKVVKDVLKTPWPLRLLHRLSLRLYIFSRTLRYANKRFGSFLIYFISVVISPYRLKHAFRSITRSFILVKSEIRRTFDEIEV